VPSQLANHQLEGKEVEAEGRRRRRRLHDLPVIQGKYDETNKNEVSRIFYS